MANHKYRSISSTPVLPFFLLSRYIISKISNTGPPPKPNMPPIILPEGRRYFTAIITAAMINIIFNNIRTIILSVRIFLKYFTGTFVHLYCQMLNPAFQPQIFHPAVKIGLYIFVIQDIA